MSKIDLIYILILSIFDCFSVIFHILPTVETPIYDWVKNITYKLNVCRQGVIADNVRSFFEAADAPLAEIIPNMAKNILQRSHQARNNDLRYNSESFQISRPNSTFMFPNANRAKSVMLFDADELPSGPYGQWDAPGLMRRNPQPYIAQHVPQMMMPSTSYAVMSIPSFFPPTTILDGEGFEVCFHFNRIIFRFYYLCSRPQKRPMSFLSLKLKSKFVTRIKFQN